jgi:flavodoxin
MKALVVYDSFFGNTERIARSIADALKSRGDVAALRVADVTPEHLAGLDLLVVGSPTRAFRPSPDIKTWLVGLPANALAGVRVAAFDTRISTEDTNSAVLGFFVKLFGYAAKPMADLLVKKGGRPVAAPEGFYVQGKEGPLKDGEDERAADWAGRLASA